MVKKGSAEEMVDEREFEFPTFPVVTGTFTG